jgi:hypothetical protein
MKRATGRHRVEAELVALASAAAAALVGAMAKDGWSQAKAGMVALWRRHRPGQDVAVEDALESSRGEIVNADEAAHQGLVDLVQGRWQGRLETLLEEHPEAANDLLVLVEQLRALTGKQDTVQVVQHVHADRDAYTAARDQHITLRPEE